MDERGNIKVEKDHGPSLFVYAMSVRKERRRRKAKERKEDKEKKIGKEKREKKQERKYLSISDSAVTVCMYVQYIRM